MAGQRALLHFKKTSAVTPKDGQVCLVFNPCDGYRIAEWYAPGNCFEVFHETLDTGLAVLWMELPDFIDTPSTEESPDVLSVEIIQIV